MLLKDWLEKKGMTTAFLAEELDVHPKQVYRMANGETKTPYLAKLIQEYTKGEVTMIELTFPEDFK